jgi:hypothetical protein
VIPQDAYVPLSEPVHAWHFNLALPPDESEVKSVEVEFVRPGLCNALLFWCGSARSFPDHERDHVYP